MFNGYFIHALQQEFYRIFEYSTTTPVITSAETRDIRDFGYMYLMGPMIM